jgi:low temperature requirement protein LtrA
MSVGGGEGGPSARVDGHRESASRVTTVELFFDLVFVYTLIQLSGSLAGALTPAGVAQTLLMFGVLWWMYGAYAWLTNAINPRHPIRQWLLLLGMAGFLIVALAIPGAFGAGGLWFGIGYLVVVLVHTFLFLRTRSWRGMLQAGPLNIVSALLLLAAGLVHGAPVYALWVVALGIQVATPLMPAVTGGQTAFEIEPRHFVERHGLLMIVAFGESIISLGEGASSSTLDTRLALVAVLVLALTALLWWSYFGGDERRAEEAMAAAPPASRPRLAIRAYFHAHIPMLLGVVALAAGVRHSIGHGLEPVPGAEAAAIAGGITLYMAGACGFRAVLGMRPLLPRACVAVLAPVTVPLGVHVAAVAELGALIVLTGVGIMVERRLQNAAGRAQELPIST